MKRIILALFMVISASLGRAGPWVPGSQGFQLSGDGGDSAFHLNIQNTFEYGTFFDGVGMQSIGGEGEWSGSSNWGVRIGSHINAMKHQSPYLLLDMGLGLDFNCDGFGFGVGGYFVVGSIFGPTEVHINKSVTAYDPSTDFTYSAVFDYTVFVAADNSGSGVGTFDVSRTRVPDTGSTFALFGAGLGLLAFARRRYEFKQCVVSETRK